MLTATHTSDAPCSRTLASVAARSAPTKVVSPHDEVVLTPHPRRTTIQVAVTSQVRRGRLPTEALLRERLAHGNDSGTDLGLTDGGRVGDAEEVVGLAACENPRALCTHLMTGEQLAMSTSLT
jgi:hypothetical protein